MHITCHIASQTFIVRSERIVVDNVVTANRRWTADACIPSNWFHLAISLACAFLTDSFVAAVNIKIRQLQKIEQNSTDARRCLRQKLIELPLKQLMTSVFNLLRWLTLAVWKLTVARNFLQYLSSEFWVKNFLLIKMASVPSDTRLVKDSLSLAPNANGSRP